MDRNELSSQPLSFELLSWSFNLDLEWPNFIPNHYGEVDWIEFSESIGLICDVSTKYSSLGINSVKVSGIFFLIGIGSWLCCKLIKFYHTTFSKNRTSSDSQGSFGSLFKACYFGPSGAENNSDVIADEEAFQFIPQPDVTPTYIPILPRKSSLKCRSESCSCIVRSSPARCFHSTNSSPILRYRNRSDCDRSSIGTTQETSSENISELSLDVDCMTFARLDRLQEEIDLIKSNCLLMDEEFVNIKGSRNLPGLSNLMETSEVNEGQPTEECIRNAKKCFKGLYSLTTINQSISLELNDYQVATPIEETKDLIKMDMSVEEDNLPSLEWDELEDLSERSLSGDSDNQNKYCVNEMQCTDDNNIINIGPKVDVITYATSEWKGTTKKAENIRKGYSEVACSLGLNHLHRIRGDNYCAIRATMFQILTQNIPVPSAEQVYNILFQDSTKRLTETWSFTRLPYGNNINDGIRTCLFTLDQLAEKITSVDDKSSVLQHLLNSEPLLDLKLNEAVKLMMLERTVHLFECINKGQEVPLFASLLFARNTCLNVSDFMNNHLCQVGNTGGLEMIEMYLLGFTFNVSIRVIRPSAFGTEDFICFYSDDTSTSLPQVTLIAEDDRHYNILVN